MATEPKTKGTDSDQDPLAVLYGGANLVVARAESLQGLQAMCHAADDVVPTVLTARYRLRGGPVFGNLLAAFSVDMLRVRSDPGVVLRGDLLPELEPGSESVWAQLAVSEHWYGSDLLSPQAQEVGERSLEALLNVMSDHEALPPHRRLLLFCELEGDPGDQGEWAEAMEFVSQLPRNVTIVVSDAPRGWQGDPPHPSTSEIELEPGEVDHEEVFTFVEAALSGDQPADVDRLGVAPLATGLARLLLLPQTRPLTVGVQAPWGWGKSSFAAFVQEALIRRAPSNMGSAAVGELEAIEAELAGLERSTLPDGEIAALRRDQGLRRQELLARLERMAHPDVICVSFNAWRYEGSEQVWAGLARSITERLEAAQTGPSRMRSRLAYAVQQRKVQFWGGFVAPVVACVLAAVIAVLLGVTDAGDELSSWTGQIEALVPIVAVLVIAWRFFRVVQPVSAQVAGYVQGPDHAAHMGYQNEVIEDLKFLHSRLPGQPRVVVFVDDLDRCSDESIMETLQAINLVLGASDFFVVLAIDPDMIHRAIARQRGLSDGDELAERFAENYLRKIIQLPLHLPGRTADQRFGFVTQLFSPTAQREFSAARAQGNGAPPASPPPIARGDGRSPFAWDPDAVVRPRVQVLREVQDTKDELDALNAFREFLTDNPRELKRLVNVHRLVKILLLRPDAPPTVEQQRKLMAWLVFCARWPGLVDDVLRCAAGNPQEPNCVATVQHGDADLERYVEALDLDRLSAQDLAPGGTLARAARISLLVRDRPTATRRPPEAASGPAAPPAASPS
jgi:KAP family P-loop domain